MVTPIFESLLSELSYEEILGNSFISLTAGFETSSLSLTYLLYNLAVYPDCQARARAEVDRLAGDTVSERTPRAVNRTYHIESAIATTTIITTTKNTCIAGVLKQDVLYSSNWVCVSMFIFGCRPYPSEYKHRHRFHWNYGGTPLL